MDKSQEVGEWILYSQDDLETAVLLFEQRKKPLNIICFHCQQAAEKLLKAYLVSQNIAFEKTHDLLCLLNSCKTLNAKFSELLNQCLNLNPYSVITRYPSDLELIESDAKSAIASAQVVRSFILALLEGNSNG